MNTEAEIGQYKTSNGGWTPLTPSGYASALTPKWLWCKRNLVLNLTSRVPINYYYWRVKLWKRDGTVISFNCSISSNIPTGLLVDCWCVSSAVFQLFVFIGGFISLNFAGIQQSSRTFFGRGGHPPQQGVVYHNGDTHGAVSRRRRHRGVGVGSWKGCAVAQQELIT